MKKAVLTLTLMVMSLHGFAEKDIPFTMDLPWGTNHMGMYPATFHPIGFSKKGHFAYFIYKTESGGTGYAGLFRFYLLDLVNNSIVEKIEFSDDNKGNLTLEQIWDRHSARIENLLAAWKVKPVSLVLTPLPAILTNGLSFDVHTDIKIRKSESVHHADSFTVSADLGEKTKLIYSQPRADSISVKPAGILKSPWEDRAAVILIEYFSGSEGSLDAYPLVIGCDLAKGFQ